MKNQELWKPSKFVMTRNGLRASRDPNEVRLGSRFTVDIMGSRYEALLREHARGKMLDLGCGKAPLYEVYREFVDEIVCVDWPNSTHQTNCLDHEFDLNREIPLAAESFDTILLSDVLEHIAEPDLLWSEMVRLLKPGAKLLVGVPFFYPVHEAPNDFARYTEFKLRRWCEASGLTVLHLEPFGSALHVICDLIAKNIEFSSVLSRLFLSLSTAAVRSPIGRRHERKRASVFPLGYFLVGVKH